MLLRSTPAVVRGPRRWWPAAVVPLALLAGCVIDIGTLGGLRSGATAINERGVTVGWSETESGGTQAFRRPLGGPMVALEGEGGRANAVNDAGVVVGSAFVGSPDGAYAPVYWDAEGTLHNLNELDLGLDPSTGLVDINDDGVILGASADPVRSHLFLLDIDTMTVEFLPFAFHDDGAEDHIGAAINDDGAVVGEVCAETTVCRAVLWQAGSHEPVVLRSPEGQTAGRADDINDRGTVVGQAYDGLYGESTVLWRAESYDEPVVIEAPEGTLFSGGVINNRDQVLGSTTVPGEYGVSSPVVWNARTGRFTDLGGLGGSLSHPADINDAGVAVGSATTPEGPGEGDGVTHAVIYHTRHRS